MLLCCCNRGNLSKELRGCDKRDGVQGESIATLKSSKSHTSDLCVYLSLTVLFTCECITLQSHVSNMSLKKLLLLAMK